MLAEPEQAEVVAERVRPAALDQRDRRIGRRGIGRFERQRLPNAQRQVLAQGPRLDALRLALRAAAQAVDAREPHAAQRAHEVGQIALELLGRRRRNALDESPVRRLEGREARGIALRAVLGVETDRAQRERVRVDDAVALLHEQRIARCNAVELREREAARRVGELLRRPTALHHDPLPFRRRRGFARQDAQRFAARVDAVESRLQVPTLHGTRKVEVIVDEAGNHGRAADVDDLRRGADVTTHVVVRADGDDTSVVDRNGLRDREVGIDGEDLAVRHDDVCGRLCERHAVRRKHEQQSGEQR